MASDVQLSGAIWWLVLCNHVAEGFHLSQPSSNPVPIRNALGREADFPSEIPASNVSASLLPRIVLNKHQVPR